MCGLNLTGCASGEESIVCKTFSNVRTSIAQSCPQRNDPGSKLVLLRVVIVGSLALTKMSRRIEVRL